ncbi:MAG: hypothetical protein ACU0CC_08930 [Sagittula sp.]|jgi:hypothetical protein|nr:hypothetical protein [Sagittula sp. P11]
MKAMVMGFVAVAVIGVAAHYGLEALDDTTAARQTTGESVRLD